MLNTVYEKLRDTYSCTLGYNSITQVLSIDIGVGYILNITLKKRNGLYLFTIVSNRSNRPVNIICPVNDNGYIDLSLLYRFIDDFASLL